MGAPKTVSDASFADDVLMSDKPVIVDFWAEWCGPCKMIAPILEEIAAENDGLVVAKLNVDENPQTAASYGITSIPTMNVYSGGQVVKTIIGAKPKQPCSPTWPNTSKHVLRRGASGRPSPRFVPGSRSWVCVPNHRAARPRLT
jgi:thioredoxin